MRVFVTGATGFVGTAVVQELLSAGHQVTGLARSEAAAQKLIDLGAEVHRGDLNDIPSLQAGATAADGVIHLGFIHDFSRFKEMCAVDGKAIEAIGETLAGTDRPFIVTSGTGVIAKDSIITEQDRLQDDHSPRSATERAVDKIVAKGVRASVVRLPPCTHGEGDKGGFIPLLTGIAKERGSSAMIKDGSNVWPAVHKEDAARLYRLALEANAPGGTRYHAVAEQGVPFKIIATAIGEKLGLPVISLQPDDIAAHFTWFAYFAQFNNLSSAAITQNMLGWTPIHPSLREDLEGDVYFPANN
ncbi:SDR family oxidoreductase [Chitinophaga qingshengii]|uniref:SDR family oxidoreductase n=1 Tax=Chitinophaga qingshengii TaxID=1569794 RepID=A0ABR7TTQ9_9BACT|nr:SDR family oxidoreductase [Chitinophaga qingshengii]MBC9932789.1 SDR family oxidoreductase [Chitinophaga qingshengii]